MSGYEFSDELISNIKSFVVALKEHPDILHSQQVSFFREYLESLGAKIPSPSTKSGGDGDLPPKASAPKEPEPMDSESDEEPDEPFPEIDTEGLLDPDTPNANQEMGDLNKTPTDDEIDSSNEFKREAVGLYNEGNFAESIEKYTEAIKRNSTSALLFAKRGQAFIQLGKPNACIKDCDRALEINPDSAVAYKFRGRAHRLLGHWHEAAADLRQACKIDFDEQADEWLKEVTPNARKVEEWQVRKTRHDEEKELNRRKKLAEERRRAHQTHHHDTHHHDDNEDDGDFQMPKGGAGIPGLEKLLGDPEILKLFSDPEVSAAFADITQNPMNIMKYQSNPKVAKLMKLMQEKIGGAAGGSPFGGAGGNPFGGAGGNPFGGAGGMPFGGAGGMPFGGAGGKPFRGGSTTDDID